MSSEQSNFTPLSGRLRFLSTAEGGRHTPPASGVRSQLLLPSGEMTSCVVTAPDGAEYLPLGSSVRVSISLLFPELYHAKATQIRALKLYEGKKLVAVGEVDG